MNEGMIGTDRPVQNKETGKKLMDMLTYHDELLLREQGAFKDLYYVMERLDAVANRLNSVDYSKNMEQIRTDNISISMNKPTADPTPPDGLVAELGRVGGSRSVALSELRENIIPNLLTAVGYIETHI